MYAESFEQLNVIMKDIAKQLERIADELGETNERLDNVTGAWKDGQEHIVIGGVIDTFEPNEKDI